MAKRKRNYKQEYRRRIALGKQRGLPRSAARGHARVGEGEVRVDRSMVGGFTMTLTEDLRRPNLRVKHVTRRMAFINFADPGAHPKRSRADRHTRGFFLDLKTLAAALTSKSHSLDSLAKFLEMPSKIPFQDFGRAIDAEFIGYALADTQATWRCYQELMRRFYEHRLMRPLPHRIYSEASLGKAYLREMGIKPWRQIQPDFDPEIIGSDGVVAVRHSVGNRARGCDGGSPDVSRSRNGRRPEAK